MSDGVRALRQTSRSLQISIAPSMSNTTDHPCPAGLLCAASKMTQGPTNRDQIKCLLHPSNCLSPQHQPKTGPLWNHSVPHRDAIRVMAEVEEDYRGLRKSTEIHSVPSELQSAFLYRGAGPRVLTTGNEHKGRYSRTRTAIIKPARPGRDPGPRDGQTQTEYSATLASQLPVLLYLFS